MRPHSSSHIHLLAHLALQYMPNLFSTKLGTCRSGLVTWVHSQNPAVYAIAAEAPVDEDQGAIGLQAGHLAR